MAPTAKIVSSPPLLLPSSAGILGTADVLPTLTWAHTSSGHWSLGCSKMLQDAPRCFKMLQDALRMLQDARWCFGCPRFSRWAAILGDMARPVRRGYWHWWCEGMNRLLTQVSICEIFPGKIPRWGDQWSAMKNSRNWMGPLNWLFQISVDFSWKMEA